MIGILLALGAYLLLKDTAQGQVRLAGGFAFDRHENPVLFWSIVCIGALLGNVGVGMTIITFLMLVGLIRT
jgi:hypothetical protein